MKAETGGYDTTNKIQLLDNYKISRRRAVRMLAGGVLAAAGGLCLGLPSLTIPKAFGASVNPSNLRTLNTPNPMTIFVRGTDGNLWLEHDWGAGVPPPRTQVDGGVSGTFEQAGESQLWRTPFQAVNNTEIFVLGSDGNLWLEYSPFNSVPPTRSQVDGSVAQFQVIDSNHVFVLGSDGNLWLENGPPFCCFDNVPVQRTSVAGGIYAFQALDANTVFALDGGGNLWLTQGPFPNQRGGFQFSSNSTVQVDAKVANFTAVSKGIVYVQGSDLNLWKETGTFADMQATLSNRVLVDQNVNAVQPFYTPSKDFAYVQGHDGNLWFESGSWGESVPPPRTLVDDNCLCWGANPYNSTQLVLIDGDQNLWYENYVNGIVSGRVQVDGSVYACQPMWPRFVPL